jgi:hypothetical protein
VWWPELLWPSSGYDYEPNYVRWSLLCKPGSTGIYAIIAQGPQGKHTEVPTLGHGPELWGSLLNMRATGPNAKRTAPAPKSADVSKGLWCELIKLNLEEHDWVMSSEWCVLSRNEIQNLVGGTSGFNKRATCPVSSIFKGNCFEVNMYPKIMVLLYLPVTHWSLICPKYMSISIQIISYVSRNYLQVCLQMEC